MDVHRFPGHRQTNTSLRLLLAGACLGAFALRMAHLATPVLRWDEGWTIAHGALPWPEVIRIAALEWHPPLFYLLYKLWQSLIGVNAFAARALAVLAGVLTVPLTYVAAMAWVSDRRVAATAALCNAALPLLVYYGQVNRMYAWTPVGVLLAIWALLRAAKRATWTRGVGAGFATAIALYFLTIPSGPCWRSTSTFCSPDRALSGPSCWLPEPPSSFSPPGCSTPPGPSRAGFSPARWLNPSGIRPNSSAPPFLAWYSPTGGGGRRSASWEG